MVKKIIHVADIHIRKTMDNWENDMYSEQLTKFIEECQKIAEPYEYDEVRIVICGDLFHNKNNISNDLDVMATNFIRQLEGIAPVRIIAGNHDYNAHNLDQSHTIATFCETRNFENVILLDELTNFRSGIVRDDNVSWVIYSAFDNFIKPDIISEKLENPNQTYVGLYHDMVIGAKLVNGAEIDCGLSGDNFEGCDFVMAGHLHKRQALRQKGVDIVYSGSLIQQDFGETTTQHGFCLWDVKNKTYEFIDIKSEYGFYQLEINSIDDIDENHVQILNL